MSGPSHGLHLVLKLASIESAYAGSAILTKDHLFLGLLKVVDVDLSEYLSDLSLAEQLATTGEIARLREAFGDMSTTKLRRSLRARVGSQERARDDITARPRPSRECEKLLSQLSATQMGWGCLGLLSLILESPGKATGEQLAEASIHPATMLARAGEAQGEEGPIGFARVVAQLHMEWRRVAGESAPDLSDLWRRIVPSAVLEFDGKGGLSLMQGSHCLLRLTGAQTKSRETMLGKSLAQSIGEFEEGTSPQPCKAPLAEF